MIVLMHKTVIPINSGIQNIIVLNMALITIEIINTNQINS